MTKKPSIWLFEDYKEFLNALITQNGHISGFRSKLADGAGCQRSFLSQVLNGPTHLTLDHGAQLSHYLHLSKIERNYLLELLTYARAATQVLKEISQEKLQELREKAVDLSERVQLKSLPDGLAESIYYSSWHYAAVHASLAISEVNTVEKISQNIKLKPTEVLHALEQLQKIGLVQCNDSIWELTSESIHLPKNSPYSAVNQFNWRQKAIQKLQSLDNKGVHYSGLFVISEEAREKIHAAILKSIEESHETAMEANCEKLTVLNCDFFEL